MCYLKNMRVPSWVAWAAAIFGMCTSVVRADDAAGCKPVKYERQFIAIEVTVRGGGRQCLVQDLVQRRLIDLDNGRSTGRPSSVIRFFEASSVDLDLQSHLVSSEPFEDSTGITLSNDEPLFDNETTRELYRRALKDGSSKTIKEAMWVSHDLIVRNGVIRTPGKWGVGVYLGFYKYYRLATDYGSPAYALVPEDEHPMSRQVEAQMRSKSVTTFIDPWNYQPETRFTLDNLNIKAGGRGVIMTGAKNVLRNSTIEVDSDTAVYLYGPGSIVEGNTFIIHQDPKYPYPAERPAILKLRDADGAVIRNNRFIVKSGPFGLLKGQTEAAINLLESKDVVIENNVIEGAKNLVRKDDASTVTERENKFQ